MTKFVGSFLKTCGVFVVMLLIVIGVESFRVFAPTAAKIAAVFFCCFGFVMFIYYFYEKINRRGKL